MDLRDKTGTPAKLRELADGIEKGKTIQFQQLDGGWTDWNDDTNISFSSKAATYRVKPEPLVVWVNVYAGGIMAYHRTEDKARREASSQAVRVAVKFVEATTKE